MRRRFGAKGKCDMTNKTVNRIPAGYVIRKTETALPPAKPVETPAAVAEHVAARLAFLEKMGVDPALVRVAREMAARHVPTTSKAEADAKLDDLLLLLKNTQEAVAAEEKAARFPAIFG